MIKELELGEIVRINKREYLLIEIGIGCSLKKRVALILLNNTLKGIYRKPYFKLNKFDAERGLK